MNVVWKRVGAHTRYPFRIARPGSSVEANGTRIERIIVSIERDGVVGRGEAAPAPYYGQSLESVDRTLSRLGTILGNDPGDIDAIIDRLLEAFDDQRAAVSAIDMALHDWLGRARGLPLWRVLGLDESKTPPTSMTIGIDRLDLLDEKVAGAADFGILKVKVGTEGDVETLSAVRRLAPDKRLRVDANGGWPPHGIVERLEAVLGFDLELVEQPTRSGEFDAVRRARAFSAVPLIADEDCVRPGDVGALAGVYDGINVKLCKCGGVREAMRMMTEARRQDLKVMIGCMVETSLGVSAAAHIASLADFVDLDGHLLLADDPFTGLVLRDGVVAPGDGAGLGVEPIREL